ncbi:MAG: RNA methyltransferase [Planctomycetes bacterium]|nr:RNA methyltransferase [Planctomycetota bacterium]
MTTQSPHPRGRRRGRVRPPPPAWAVESGLAGIGPSVSSATREDLAHFGWLRKSQCPEGYFIGEGPRVVRRMLDRGAAIAVLGTPEWILRLSIDPAVKVLTAAEEDLRAIVGWRFHRCVMAMGRIPDPGPLRGSLLVALDRLNSAENVGAILRTCAALGVDGVLVGPETASPWLRRAIRASIAAPLDVPCHFVKDLPAALAPLRAYAAHPDPALPSYADIDYRENCCIVFGSEDEGVSTEVREACRGTIQVPMAPGWDSLNVAACAAIILSEALRQRSQASDHLHPCPS